MIFADRRRYAVALAGASAFLNLYSPQAVLPLLQTEFGTTEAGIALIMFASILAVALTAPFTGAIADVIGRKRVITGAMIALVIPTAMSALSPNLETMIFWRFVQGLVLPPIFAVTMAYIGGEMPADEATGMTGTYIMGATLGGFTGRLLTGLLAEPIGWRNAFLVDAALIALLAIAVIVLLPREKKFVRAANLKTSLKQMVQHLHNPKLMATYAVGFGVLFNFIATFTFISFHLAAAPFNLTPAQLGLIFTVYLVGTFIVPLVGQGVSRFGRRRFVIAVLALWICGVLLTLVPSLPAVIVGLTVAAACGFLCQASSQAYVATSSKTGISASLGLYATAFYAGGSAGALLPGLAWEAAKWPGAVAMVVAMQTIMMLIVWLAWGKDRR
ncbi:MAG TPA: MFS transporter [Pseudorhodoplanes sp.]|nr:MFS transporter [Pseudorhodoplanes sp.]